MPYRSRRTDWHNLSAKVPKSSSPLISGMLISLTSHAGVVGRDTLDCSPRCIVIAICCWVWRSFATRGVQHASRISGAGVPASWLSWQPSPLSPDVCYVRSTTRKVLSHYFETQPVQAPGFVQLFRPWHNILFDAGFVVFTHA